MVIIVVNQKGMIDRIAEKTGLYKKDIKEMLHAFKEVIYDVAEEEAELLCKEVFYIKTVNMKGRNRYIAPYKEIVYQDEHKILKIVPSRLLLDTIKDKEKQGND